MSRLIGEAYVQVTQEDITELRELLDDPSFVWTVGTDNVPKFAAVLKYAEIQIGIAGNITLPEGSDG
jgi:hypothetical protein